MLWGKEVQVERRGSLGDINIRVKDSAGPCDCIKDSDGSRPEKKTRIDFTPALILCL